MMVFKSFGISVDSDILSDILGRNAKIHHISREYIIYTTDEVLSISKYPTSKYIDYIRIKKIDDILE